MVDLIKNKKGVSQILGFVLSLSLTSAVVVSAGFLASNYVDENTRSAAQTQAENLAAQVTNLLVNAYLVKQQYPNASYNTSIEIPLRLVNHFDYSITVDNNAVHVDSRDGRIQVTKTFYSISENLQMDVTGSVDGSEGKLTVSCDKTNYVYNDIGGYWYKFDFGTDDEVYGYTAIKKDDLRWDITDPPLMSVSRGGSELGEDFVYTNDGSSATFTISGLTPGDPYSLTFSVGDKEDLVNNMYIIITGGDVSGLVDNVLREIGPITFTDLNEPYGKFWESNIYPKSDGSLDIEFSDKDNTKWTICGMTVEEGERTIRVRGGE